MGRKLPAGMTYKQLIVLAVVIITAIVVSKMASESLIVQEVVQSYGYFGVLIASVISSINPIVPIPAVTFVPVFISAGLNFWPIVIVLVLGVTLGDTIGYFIGRAGFTVLSGHMTQYMEKIEKWRERYPRAPLFILFLWTLISPMPNEILVIPLALAGYSLKKLLPILLVGNFIFNTVLASGVLAIFDNFL